MDNLQITGPNLALSFDSAVTQAGTNQVIGHEDGNVAHEVGLQHEKEVAASPAKLTEATVGIGVVPRVSNEPSKNQEYVPDVHSAD